MSGPVGPVRHGDHMNPLRLSAAGLFSKWGYGDGDCLDEWWWDTFDQPLGQDVDDHEVLADLVERLLVPAIRAAGHDVITYRIETNHNPIRASTADGEPVDVYGGEIPAWADEVWVEITPAGVRELVAS